MPVTAIPVEILRYGRSLGCFGKCEQEINKYFYFARRGKNTYLVKKQVSWVESKPITLKDNPEHKSVPSFSH